MQQVESTIAPLETVNTKKKKRRSIWVKLRPVYPFLALMAIWQVAAMRARGNLGQLFPTLDAIAIRTWELITDPLTRALTENPDLSLWKQIWVNTLSNWPKKPRITSSLRRSISRKKRSQNSSSGFWAPLPRVT